MGNDVQYMLPKKGKYKGKAIPYTLSDSGLINWIKDPMHMTPAEFKQAGIDAGIATPEPPAPDPRDEEIAKLKAELKEAKK